MLSERLKSKALFVTVGDANLTKTDKALDVLDECVHKLILAMKATEHLGLLPREDIEDYVLCCMEAFEKRYYSLEEDEFDRFIKDFLKRR